MLIPDDDVRHPIGLERHGELTDLGELTCQNHATLVRSLLPVEIACAAVDGGQGGAGGKS